MMDLKDIWEKIAGQHWPWYSHQRLYDMVRTEAEGARAVAETEAEIAEFTKLMAESVEDVEHALAEAGVTWKGLAADSMSAGVSPLAQWAQDAGTAGGASGDSASQVGESFAHVANAMPEPVPTPSRTLPWPPSPADVIAMQVDQDAAEREAQQAKQRAVELMDGYSANSKSAMGSLGAFVPPQEVTVSPPVHSPGMEDSAASIEGPTGGDGSPGGGSPGDGSPGGGSPGDDGSGAADTGDPGRGGPAGHESPPRAAAPAPGPGGGSPGTAIAQASVPPATAPAVPAGGPVTGTTSVAPFGPVSGAQGGPVAGQPGGRGSAGGPGAGRTPGGGAPGRGGLTGAGPVAGEGAAGARGTATPAVRGGAGTGMAPVGGGAGRREEDQERTSPEYLREYRDEFWDDTPAVAPPVIGDDD